MDQVEHWANQDEVAPAIPVGVLVRFQTGSIFQVLTCTCWKKNQSQLEKLLQQHIQGANPYTHGIFAMVIASWPCYCSDLWKLSGNPEHL